MIFRASVTLVACALALPLVAAEPVIHGDAAVIDIATTVKRSAPSRFGFNIDSPHMTHWGEEPFHNEWWAQPNLNPFETRLKLMVSGGGGNDVEVLTEKQGGPKWGPGMGFYDLFRDGYFDGGEAWIYRYEGNKATLLRQGVIKTYLASKDGANRFTFAEDGPAVRAGDEVVLRVLRYDVPLGMQRGLEKTGMLLNRFRILDAAKDKAFTEAGGRMVIDREAPVDGGGGSLRIDTPVACGPTPIGFWYLSALQADWPRLRPGATYVLRFAAKSDAAKPEVLVQVASLSSSTVSLVKTWKTYEVRFTGAPPKSGAEPLLFTVPVGNTWLDNVTLTEECSTPAGAFYPEVVDTIKRFRPSTMRLWSLHCNRGFGRALMSGLAPRAEAPLEMTETSGAQTSTAIGLHQELELCKAIGTAPWIIISTMSSPQEYDQIMEYLGGPADSPMGRLRARWGHPQPWTEVFDHIKIEFGNETWNNSFIPQGFVGRPKQYGALAQLVFSRMQASAYHRSDRFTWVTNGWAALTSRQWGYGPQAIEAAPAADASDIAYYTGGWDAVGLIKSDSPDEGWRNILTYSYRMLRPRSEEYAKVMADIGRERGRPITPLVYEAGPGYTLPGPGKFDLQEQREGKSMAQAVNSLDSFMTNIELGFGDQSFFLFRNGHYWASHNRTWGEHIAYKALGMRNDLLRGDLMVSSTAAMITMDLPEAEAMVLNQSNSAQRNVKKFPAMAGVPLVACYPFKDGKRWSYMLYSRRSDAAVPVTLRLPYTPSPQVDWYTLGSEDPSAHNIDTEAVTVTHELRQDGAKDYSFSLPPFTVLVLVNEER